MQKSFKGAWGQISPTSEKWLQATLLAKCEAGRVRTAARAAKRALFALLASPFPILQSHPIFNRGRAPAEYDQGQNPAIPYNIKIAQQIRWASIHILARPDSTMNNERVDLLRIHSQIIRMHISFLIARPCDFRPFARYAPHGYRLSSA